MEDCTIDGSRCSQPHQLGCVLLQLALNLRLHGCAPCQHVSIVAMQRLVSWQGQSVNISGAAITVIGNGQPWQRSNRPCRPHGLVSCMTARLSADQARVTGLIAHMLLRQTMPHAEVTPT